MSGCGSGDLVAIAGCPIRYDGVHLCLVTTIEMIAVTLKVGTPKQNGAVQIDPAGTPDVVDMRAAQRPGDERADYQP